MNAKKALATKIISDFHSERAAKEAAENWEKIFQKREVPEDIETVHVRYALVCWIPGEADSRKVAHIGGAKALGVKVDQLLLHAGFVASASEGGRKIKEGAVRIGDEVQSSPRIVIGELNTELPIRVGRKLKKVILE